MSVQTIASLIVSVLSNLDYEITTEGNQITIDVWGNWYRVMDSVSETDEDRLNRNILFHNIFVNGNGRFAVIVVVLVSRLWLCLSRPLAPPQIPSSPRRRHIPTR